MWLEKITFLGISRLQVTVLAFLDLNLLRFKKKKNYFPADTFLCQIASKDVLYCSVLFMRSFLESL